MNRSGSTPSPGAAPRKPTGGPSADPAARKPAGGTTSVDSGRHAGQEGDRIDAELRNVSEGYDGPKVKEDRGTPRRVAKDEGQLDK